MKMNLDLCMIVGLITLIVLMFLRLGLLNKVPQKTGILLSVMGAALAPVSAIEVGIFMSVIKVGTMIKTIMPLLFIATLLAFVVGIITIVTPEKTTQKKK